MTAQHFVLFLAITITLFVALQFGARIGIAVCDFFLRRLGREVPNARAKTITLTASEPHRYKKGDELLVYDAFTAKTHRIVKVSEDRTTITVEPV